MVMFFLLLMAATRPSRTSLPPSSGTILVPDGYNSTVFTKSGEQSRKTTTGCHDASNTSIESIRSETAPLPAPTAQSGWQQHFTTDTTKQHKQHLQTSTVRIRREHANFLPESCGVGAWELWGHGVFDAHRDTSAPGRQHGRWVHHLGAESR